MQALCDLLRHNDPNSLLILLGIYVVSAIFSGLSGFGFSAIGCLSLAILPPQLGVPVLMGLSLATQAFSLSSLWGELRHHVGSWRRGNGVVPYLVGGTVGMPIGLAILSMLEVRCLTTTLGVLLIGYSTWSLLKPATLRLKNVAPSIRRSFLVGAAGGVVGGFSAFPGSAVVVWSSLVGTTKEETRALTQPFVLWMQIAGLGLLVLTRPQLFDESFWSLLVASLPIALLGNFLGVLIYRSTGDMGYRRVTLFALGVSGVGLLVKMALPSG